RPGDDLRHVPHPARAARARPRARHGRALRQCHAAAAGIRHRIGDDALFRGGAGDRPPRHRRDHGDGEVPDARGGHRMTTLQDLPGWAALLTSALILLGSALTLIGSFGLLRMKSFYERVHAPTLGATLGM